MKNHFLSVILSIAIFLIFGVSAHVSSQTISGSIGNGIITRGSAAKGSVILSIPGGLHVNSSRPNSQYAIATDVRVSGQGVKTSSVRYPSGRNRKFNFSENQINVYEGRTVFPFTVNVPVNFSGNTVKVRAVVKYQACTEEVCYPPKTKEVTLTAKVK
jgi:thiol:disulfide interchange protein